MTQVADMMYFLLSQPQAVLDSFLDSSLDS